MRFAHQPDGLRAINCSGVGLAGPCSIGRNPFTSRSPVQRCFFTDIAYVQTTEHSSTVQKCIGVADSRARTSF